MRRWTPVIAFLTSLVVLAAGLTPASAVVDKQQLVPGYGSYARLIRLQFSPFGKGHILASLTSEDGGGKFTPIMESTDEGASFHKIGEIRDPDGKLGECCGTLYELPQRVGRLRAGTVLWAASYRQDAGAQRRIGIKVWASSAGGKRWTYLSEAAISHNHDGIWEPEFTVDAGGTLWLHYADETQAPKYAQVLNRVASTDGIHWGTKQLTLAIPPTASARACRSSGACPTAGTGSATRSATTATATATRTTRSPRTARTGAIRPIRARA